MESCKMGGQLSKESKGDSDNLGWIGSMRRLDFFKDQVMLLAFTGNSHNVTDSKTAQLIVF